MGDAIHMQIGRSAIGEIALSRWRRFEDEVLALHSMKSTSQAKEI